MNNFKKALLVSIVFVVIAILGSCMVIVPYVYLNRDRLCRDEMAGTIDTAFIGASHGVYSFVPSIIDEELDVNCYNLCGLLMTFNGRKALLDQELARNPIKHLVIEISYDCVQRETYTAEGNANLLPRLSGLERQMTYYFSNTNLYDFDTFYGKYFSEGVKQWLTLGKGIMQNLGTPDLLGKIKEYQASACRETKGTDGYPANDVSIKSSDVAGRYNRTEISEAYNSDNLAVLSDIITECKDMGVDVSVVVVPVSDGVLWEASNMETFHRDLVDYCESMDVSVYDFNLLSNRYELFSDTTSFCDANHLSEDGAEVFTKEYCKIMKEAYGGRDISGYFYESYDELKVDSPYWGEVEN